MGRRVVQAVELVVSVASFGMLGKLHSLGLSW